MRSLLVVFLLICISSFLVISQSSDLDDDVLGLISFKADIQDLRDELISWNENLSPCNNSAWAGVKCNPIIYRVSELVLDGFSLSGKLSRGLLKLRFLRKLSLANNSFTGGLNLNFSQLPHLRVLNLSENRLSGLVPSVFFGQHGSLSSISLAKNNFSGPIPKTLSLCLSLVSLNLSGNQFSGPLPLEIWSVPGLRSLDLSDNLLEGEIPTGVERLINLTAIILKNNQLSGKVPDGIGKCPLLETIYLSWNKLSGGLPSTMQKLSWCRVIFLGRNQLASQVPKWIGELKSLTILDLSENQLNGSIPLEVGGLEHLEELRLEKNSLVGNIPSSIGNCLLLKSLSISNNHLTGSIPPSLSNLTDLENIDLSFNKLSGNIPSQLSNLRHLRSFDISHNQLQGQLPPGNFFSKIPTSSISDNPSLCVGHSNSSCPAVLPKPIVLNPNSTTATPNTISPNTFSRGKKVLSVSVLIAICAAGAILVGVIFVTVLNLRVRSSASRPPISLSSSSEADDGGLSSSGWDSGKLVVFSGVGHDLGALAAGGPHGLLSKDHELGRGGFGPVYWATLWDERTVAVRRLAVSGSVRPGEDFEREVRKLGKADHVNLVGLVGYYWAPSLQLLIYEFVPRGSLHARLHEGSPSDGNRLQWDERFNIILGTARGLAHLHKMNLIHYNLKSTNVLLDNSGGPKVADYGLARLLPGLDCQEMSGKIQSTLGYTAPEFACETVRITEKCDVYAFGVLVLEVVTGRRPVEYTEDDVVVLCDMVKGAMEEGKIEGCVDSRLIGEILVDEVIPAVKIGLMCTSHVPSSRPSMDEVVKMLELVRCLSRREDECLTAD